MIHFSIPDIIHMLIGLSTIGITFFDHEFQIVSTH